MLKIATGTFLSLHLALDVVITQIFLIFFAMEGRYELAAAVPVADSLLKLTLALPGAAVASLCTQRQRLVLCSIIRPAATCIWIAAVESLTRGQFHIAISLFLTFKLAAIIDGTMSSDLQFLARDAFGIDLTQQASIQNIIARGSLAIAPAIALKLNQGHLSPDGALPLLAAFSVGSFYMLRARLAPQANNTLSARKQGDTTRLYSGIGVFRNKLMRWGLLYQLTVNFSFSGITYLLAIELQGESNFSLNSLTIFYALFFSYQIAVMIAGDTVVPAKEIRHIVVIITLSATATIAVGITNENWLTLILCAIMGILYGFEIQSIQKIVIAGVRGPDFIEYCAWSKTCSRIASAASVAILGFAVGSGVPSPALLVVSGLLGCASALLLNIVNPERTIGLSS
ncbi:hypothetical protein WKR88_09250 [Trinickia caryophylli]|uniref:Major Facilitator Superfamily protein n=1 Tax=Trinickia caryophylli TaxID=28094 RepID=A0A1X7FBM0_TRICW|nr:hypothetical protein [Trinickia caryophylli]PMS10923.1 hypothetical protein C0Z17_17235 [Trinickia caryophylli]TRX18865.1 hypothetical protein FNF07_11940 [Trinickia caryophylli]WQE10336.1 hypothetical protein U0034_10975 [Trinickia caryophylli]SMF49281.1 hypothetical protein SAMN06295900_108147 [Trinickia caryophylli]GLU34216.1 hypothetical protein Busp01_40580 [Trinickia caryophylli]